MNHHGVLTGRQLKDEMSLVLYIVEYNTYVDIRDT